MQLHITTVNLGNVFVFHMSERKKYQPVCQILNDQMYECQF